jgi:GNAT superfamily N-acetyltransferase
MEFRKATVSDIPTMVDYRIDFMEEFLGKQPEEKVMELKTYLRNYFKEAIVSGAYVCYLALDEGYVAGMGGIVFREQPGSFKNPSGRVGYLMNMYTVPSYRKKGICSRILEQLIEEGKQRGLVAFELHATKDGEPVYQKRDFKFHTEPTYRRYL